MSLADPGLAGLIYAFLAGLLFAVSDVMVRAASRGVPPAVNVVLSLAVGTPLLYAASFVAGEEPPGAVIAAGFALIGLLHFVVGRLMFYTAVAGMGASTASILVSPTMLLSSFMAWILLGEPIGAHTLASMALITASVYLSASRPSGPGLWVTRRAALAAGLLASLVFAVTAVSIRLLSLQGGPPIMGAAISYTAALPASLLVASRSLRGLGLGGLARPFTYYSLAGGVAVTLAQMFRYMSLDSAPVAHALVLISLFPVHTAIISALTPGISGERVGPRHLAASILGFAGVAVLVYYEY